MTGVARFETAKDIINDVAVECGLNENSTPFNSNDPAFRQLIRLTKTCGRLLVAIPGWSASHRTHTFTITEAVEYALPADFMSLIDSTTYDRSNRQALYGSASPQMWTIWLNENPSISFKALYRIANRKLCIAPGTVPVGSQVSFEYRSRAWVQDATNPANIKDRVDGPGDVILFESVLFTRFLRYKFLDAKGFDTASSLAEFQAILDTVKGSDTPAEILNTSRRVVGSRFLDTDNLPDSGFG
jgi:hypothetical protein